MNLLEFHKQIKGYTQNRQPENRDMDPRPISELNEYKAAGKLQGKVALILVVTQGLVALLRSYLKRALM